MTPRSPFERFRPHPWHGISAGPEAPGVVRAYIEITPFDTVKYEIDKATGYLCVDRPQGTSSLPPALYGFIPRTYCADQVAELSPGAVRGDGDPLDICVISERPVNHPEVLLYARVVGGIRLIDHGEADDKILAVLQGDAVWGSAEDVSDIPRAFIDRLRHYFATYKLTPDDPEGVKVGNVYDRNHAHRVIEAALADYRAAFSD